MKRSLTLSLFFAPLLLFSQNKKILDHADVHRWQKIEQPRISNDGQWTAWVQASVTEGDPALHLWNASTAQTQVFHRATDARFSEDGKLLVFKIKPALDTLKAQRRRKVKEEDLPKDTLGIVSLANGTLEKIARVKNFALPEKWSGWLFFQIEGEKTQPIPKDSTASTPDSAQTSPKTTAGKKNKAEDKENGYRLIVRNTSNGHQDTFGYVTQFVLAEKNKRFLLHTTGIGDTLIFGANPNTATSGVYFINLENWHLRPLFRAKGKFPHIALDKSGNQAAFIADTDTSKARIRPYQLCYWDFLQDSARVIADPNSNFLTQFPPTMADDAARQGAKWGISEHAQPIFSDNGSKLFFNVAPPPVLNDTTLLPEEIVNVEVWSWADKRLYTQKKVMLENEKKKGYPVVWRVSEKRFVPLGGPDMPELRLQEERDAELALGFTEEPYAHYLSSEGTAHKDLFAVDLKTGQKKQLVRDLRCNPRLSPQARYIAWWSAPDSAWFAWNPRTTISTQLTDNHAVRFFREDTDVPDYPAEHGLAGWLEGDAAMLVYDKYDIWQIDPEGKKKPQRLTQGREAETTYRYLKLDPEEKSIPANGVLLLHQFNHSTKAEGYAWLDLNGNKMSQWLNGDFSFSRQPLKAQNANTLLFSRGNFQAFPDLHITAIPALKQATLRTALTAPPQAISNANPQQSEYKWGHIELVHWTSFSGEKHTGLLVKPEDFDPTNQYPMIVNFYEKVSDGLHQHRSPDFHRSQINYTYYASRGYLIFAPDIHYQTGFPGESAFNAIMSGVAALIEKGFVAPKRVALQGHSWGGYQAAYIVTRTNLFACAEAGAPVANMTSAYGGIRWESGLSRAFQYERQQSRIGGTLWEYPMRFLENSPLFSLDKVQTPLLILHNDKDGAVPWYQGIELFTALRRLGKPAWLLNYNDEPHWPVKLQNRIDFQVRMAQFFDHYLLGAPQPRWMQRGVPPIEKGILQGLELAEERQ
ncbi:MAG: S9 family peptidase [Saprospiraceae bacterium]|nr:S9 family peptidase [Saprospiraceae bacterium]